MRKRADGSDNTQPGATSRHPPKWGVDWQNAPDRSLDGGVLGTTLASGEGA
jgi:hypothetical protein